MKPICFYHSADLDGVCSAAIVKHFVPDCELYGIDYPDQDKFPWDKIRPGMDAKNDPLWAHLFLPENGYKFVESSEGYLAYEELKLEKRTVYMVDFSLKAPDMVRLAKYTNLVWIDHHRSAYADWEKERWPCGGIGEGVYSPHEAACEVAWSYFSFKQTEGLSRLQVGGETQRWIAAHKSLPEAVRLLGAYDSWRKDDSEWATKILPFQYGCRALEGVYDPECKVWYNLITHAVPDADGTVWVNAGCPEDPNPSCSVGMLVWSGQAILRYQAEVNRRACEAGAHEFNLVAPPIRDSVRLKVGDCPEREAAVLCSGGMWIAIACNTIVFNSTFFESVYDPTKHDVMCAYCQLADGRWKVSLYSTKPEINCGAICKTFGGGGHAGAAGFTCEKLPWEPA